MARPRRELRLLARRDEPLERDGERIRWTDAPAQPSLHRLRRRRSRAASAGTTTALARARAACSPSCASSSQSGSPTTATSWRAAGHTASRRWRAGRHARHPSCGRCGTWHTRRAPFASRPSRARAKRRSSPGSPSPSRRAGLPLSRYLHALAQHEPEDLRLGSPTRAARTATRTCRGPARGGARAARSRRADPGPPGVARGARDCPACPPADSLDLERGAGGRVRPGLRSAAPVRECLASVLAHTPADVPILVADDASPDPAIAAFLEELEGAAASQATRSDYLRQTENVGFPSNVNSAFAAAAPGDVLVLNSDCVVGAGWFERHARGGVLGRSGGDRECRSRTTGRSSASPSATVRTRACRKTGSSTPLLRRCGSSRWCSPAPADRDRALHVRAPSGARPRGQTSTSRSRRGTARRSTSHSGASCRGSSTWQPTTCSSCITLADPSARTATRTRSGQPRRDRRSPLPVLPADADGAPARRSSGRSLAHSAARRAISGLTATIDARCLGPITTGVQVHTLEVIRALSETGRVRCG